MKDFKSMPSESSQNPFQSMHSVIPLVQYKLISAVVAREYDIAKGQVETLEDVFLEYGGNWNGIHGNSVRFQSGLNKDHL